MKRQSSLLSHFVKKNTTDEEELSDISYHDKKSKTETEVIEIRSELKWETIEQNNLHVTYSEIFTKSVCRKIFSNLEREVEYFTGELSQVKVFGKVYPIPRKQSAYGDEGVTYKYSGTIVPAQVWTNTLSQLRDIVQRLVGVRYNFVLVNRYKDGNDKMGDHKDDEKELDENIPIASLTFGAERDFIFKHENKKTMNIEDIKIVLKDGMLLLMHHPTNSYWYHGLPQRKKCLKPRINLTFRKIKM